MKDKITCYPMQATYITNSKEEEKINSQNYYFVGAFCIINKYRTYLQFDLSNVKKNNQILSAALKLYCTGKKDAGDNFTLEVCRVTSSWNANSISFSNQPDIDTKNIIIKSIESCVPGFIEIDITEYLKNWIKEPQNNFGIMIKAGNEDEKNFLLEIASFHQRYHKIIPVVTIEMPSEKTQKPLKTDPSVAILTPQFYQFSGDRCLFGGGERYLIDLAKLLQKLGYQVTVFQPSTVGKWEKEYNGIPINGICEPGVELDFYIGLNKEFTSITKNFDYHIYFNIDTIFPHTFPNSICISHGIWWDSNERKWWRSRQWYHYMFQGLSGIETLVSVDTNTINWINAVKPELKCTKLYIPNYVDLQKFKPSVTQPDKTETTVLFPRRLCKARGWDITIELAFELTEEYDNITFSFVGRAGFENTEQYMKNVSLNNPKIKYTWYDMEDMHLAYEDADIVLIPSMYSEGTSLSLLEAMACGKPIIAGLVGGLSDLIFDGYNGYLIEVTKENLKQAIIDLLENPEKRVQFGKNAREIAESFSKKIWEERWASVILKKFPKESTIL